MPVADGFRGRAGEPLAAEDCGGGGGPGPCVELGPKGV